MELFLSKAVEDSLDFDYILRKIKVRTPYGLDEKNSMAPFMPGDEEALREELDNLEQVVERINEKQDIFTDLRDIFSQIKDLRNSLARVSDDYVLTVVELFELKKLIFLIGDIEESLKGLDWDIPGDMRASKIKSLEEILDPEGNGVRTFYIYDDYSKELKTIRARKKEIDKKIILEKKKLREEIKKETGLNIRPDGEILISKGDDHLMKIAQSHPKLSYSSETYMNIKFSIKSTSLIDELIKELEILKEKEENEELRVRGMLTDHVAKYRAEILRNMKAIGRLDFLIGKAYMAMGTNGVKPTIIDQYSIDIVDGRNLKVEENLRKASQVYTPISIRLENGVTCITGANMGGKTVSLKMVGLLVAMAQYGLLVPCKSMTIGLSEFIHISVGDLQSEDQGLSTFGAEIKGIQAAINRKDKRGLILMDELARGTNPEEGYAISRALVAYLRNRATITVITTHYDNVATTEGVVHLQVVGLSKADYCSLREKLKGNKENGIELISKFMDYRLIRVTDRNQVPRDAINIARLMGLEEDILKEAERLLY